MRSIAPRRGKPTAWRIWTLTPKTNSKNQLIFNWSMSMPFPPSERNRLLAVKGVGTTVVGRLEQMGFESLQHLAKANALDLVARGATLTGSSCWKNSPQARAAIQAAIDLARAVSGEAQPRNPS
jgi:hypothetical protein